MKRRAFVRRAVGGIAAATLGSGGVGCRPDGRGHDQGESDPGALRHGTSPEASSGNPPLPAGGFKQWTWVHGGGDRTPSDWQAQYRRLAKAGFHGVLVSGGETEVHSHAAHQAGLEFHRWIWTLNRNGDAWVKSNHPEWFTVSRNGESSLTHPPYVGYYKWLCPTRPGVRDYLRDSILEIARDPMVDGIHLDYVRHSDVILPRGLWSTYDLVQDQEYPEFDFCYCETCRETFAITHDRDPLELPDPQADEAWRQFRWKSVTGVVETLSEAVHEVPAGAFGSTLSPDGISKPITAAVFPTPSIARALVRQAWDEWPLDAVFPMLYHSFYEEELDWIGRGVREGLSAMAARAPETVQASAGESHPETASPDGSSSGTTAPGRLYAGLYLPALDHEERLRATDVARNSGAHGVSFFEMNSLDF